MFCSGVITGCRSTENAVRTMTGCISPVETDRVELDTLLLHANRTA